jgi:hypothetical protein
LKRTRRVEIVRYSRRITEFTNGSAPQTDTSAERVAIDLLLQTPGPVPITTAEIVDVGHQEADANAICTVPNKRFPKFLDRLEAKLGWRSSTRTRKGPNDEQQ